MKIKQYPHGTAFKETFTVTFRGEADYRPVGWGCVSHEQKWLEDSLRDAVKEALQRYYQCRLHGCSIQVEIPPVTAPPPA